jgi:hypothetical protein
LLKCPAKTPCQNALQKWPRNPSCPPNALPKHPTKVAPKPKLPSKMPYQNSLILDREKLDKKKLNREKLDREKLDKEKLDKEKLNKEILDKEMLDKEKERREGGKKEKIKVIFTNFVYIVLKP